MQKNVKILLFFKYEKIPESNTLGFSKRLLISEPLQLLQQQSHPVSFRYLHQLCT